jgi:hypothetical protein
MRIFLVLNQCIRYIFGHAKMPTLQRNADLRAKMTITLGLEGSFRQSSFCGSGSCVEVAPRGDGGAVIRDSKSPAGQQLELTPEIWARLLGAIKSGALDYNVLQSNEDPVYLAGEVNREATPVANQPDRMPQVALVDAGDMSNS